MAEEVYQPTAAEKKLLAVLSDPNNLTLNKTEICKLAGVTRPIYYNAIKKPGFRQHLREEALDLITGDILPVVNQIISEAKAGSYRHQQMLVQIWGLLDPTLVRNIFNINIQKEDYGKYELEQLVDELDKLKTEITELIEQKRTNRIGAMQEETVVLPRELRVDDR